MKDKTCILYRINLPELKPSNPQQPPWLPCRGGSLGLLIHRCSRTLQFVVESETPNPPVLTLHKPFISISSNPLDSHLGTPNSNAQSEPERMQPKCHTPVSTAVSLNPRRLLTTNNWKAPPHQANAKMDKI